VAEIKDKVENVLNEARMMLLGVTILLGFQFNAFFQNKFDDLPHELQTMKLVGLVLLLVVVGLLFGLVFFHTIVLNGNDDTKLQIYANRLIYIALLPFIVTLALDLHTGIAEYWEHERRFLYSGAFTLVGIAGWYGYGLMKDKERPLTEQKQQTMKVELKDKIKQVLTEARLVLPGIQALLGFQFSILLMEKFDKIEAMLRDMHIAALLITLVSIVLLMAPAAYHRIVLKGENSQGLYEFSSRMIMISATLLAVGFAMDVFIACKLVSDDNALSGVVAGLLLIFFYALWFGYSYYKRNELKTHRAS